LQAEVARGTFREDLYFRLNVVSLRLPPLRERPGDIAALANHYAHHYAQLNGLPQRPLSAEALRRLSSHPWRGNVRELENAIHRAVLLSTGDAIEADAIELSSPSSSTPSSPTLHGSPGGIPGLVGQRMEDVERDLILQTLSHTLGNRTHAASILGISIRALRNKLRDYAAAGAHVPAPPTGVAA
jgi:DNA-binding NtrC family response regulator